MEGPDGLYVQEGGVDHQHGVLDDRDDHRELDRYMKELDIPLLVGGEELDRGQEYAAHNELDQW